MQEKDIAPAVRRSVLEQMLKTGAVNGTSECKIENVKVAKKDEEGKIVTAEGTFDVISDMKAKVTSGTFSSKFDSSKSYYRLPSTTMTLAKKNIAFDCSAKEVKELAKSVAGVKGFGSRRARRIGEIVMDGVMAIIDGTDLISDACNEMVASDASSYCDDYCNERRH